jgi:hypothetical protein
MKYYKKIEIDYYDEIVSDTLNYLRNQKPNIYNRTIDATYYVLDLDEFKKFCPKIDLGFERYGIVCNFAVAFVMKTSQDTPIHVDDYPRGDTRINIPILNTKGTITKFYTGGKFKEIINPITKIRFLANTNKSTIKVADMVQINQPTIIRVNEPHSVSMYLNESPRITLSLGFDKDPVFLLED